MKIPKPTHINHPCALWARESLSNWLLLREFTELLFEEYSFRYKRIHACQKVVKYLPVPDIPDIGVTPRPLAMPEDCRGLSVSQSYRDLYTTHKRHLFNWKHRPRPEWTMNGSTLLFYKKAPHENPFR